MTESYQDQRESWESYFIRLASQVAERGTCPRRKVGAVISQNSRIKATGYNGSAPGQPHCFDVGCLKNHEGRCQRTIHAEANALRDVQPEDLEKSSLWVTDMPCIGCSKLIACCPLSEVVYLRPYHAHESQEAAELIEQAGISLRQYQPKLEFDLPAWTDSAA